jgi:hypothetical protein
MEKPQYYLTTGEQAPDPATLRPAIIVFAGTKAQADSWITCNGLEREEVIVASSAERLAGIHGLPIAYVGTYYTRKDYTEIMAALERIAAGGQG